jgi:hypothetical protein
MQGIVRALIAALLVASQSASAQQTPAPVSPTAPLHDQYVVDLTGVHDMVLALANAIPAEKYSWGPSPAVRTVSQVLMHMAGEWYVLCPMSVAAKPPADFGAPGEGMRKLELIVDKPAVLAELAKSWTYCRSALDRIDPAKLVPDSLPGKMGFPRVVLRVSGDQHEHVGQLIAYARSIGVTPPWSK